MKKRLTFHPPGDPTPAASLWCEYTEGVLMLPVELPELEPGWDVRGDGVSDHVVGISGCEVELARV